MRIGKSPHLSITELKKLAQQDKEYWDQRSREAYSQSLECTDRMYAAEEQLNYLFHLGPD